MARADGTECDRWKWLQMIASEQGPPDPTTRHVLITLSLHMNQQGERAWPSQKLLAQRTGLSERAVRTHLHLAERTGWVKVYAKRPAGTKGWRLNEYVACAPAAVELPTYPWEDDSTWQREEPPSAPSNGHAEAGAARSGDVRNTRAANGAVRAEAGAERAAADDPSCGTSFHFVRKDVPTNPSGNPSVNPSWNPSHECALARTAPVKRVSEKGDPEARRQRILKALATPEYSADSDEAIARFTQTTAEEVRRERAA